jgi:hypothetical protein
MRSKKKLKSTSPKAATVRPPIVEKEKADNPMDFGGIEPRDLKKNLGCG